jgi:hypothetical protein
MESEDRALVEGLFRDAAVMVLVGGPGRGGTSGRGREGSKVLLCTTLWLIPLVRTRL